MFCLSVSLWSYFYFAWQQTESQELALLFVRLLMAGAILIPIVYFHHVLLFLDRVERHRLSLSLGYLLGAIFLLADCTPYFVQGLRSEMSFPYWPRPGILFHGYLVWFAGYAVYSTYLIISEYRNAIGLKKNQYLYLAIGSVIGYVGGATNFPLWYDIPLPPVGTILVSAYVSIIAYTILRYRLLDISVVISKGLAYSLLLTSIFVPIYATVLISQRATLYSIPPLLAGTLIFSCGLWVVLNNYKKIVNITFGLVCLGACIWLFSFFMIYSAPHAEAARFWGKFIYLGMAYIPAFFYHFCTSFLGLQTHTKRIAANYIIGTLLLLLIPTPHLIDGQYTYFWGYYPKAGNLHPLFLIYFFSVSAASLLKLYRGGYQAKEESIPFEATRSKYAFWAFVIGYLASIDFIQSYGYEFYPTGYLFVSLWVMIITYAILKYQLMDIAAFRTKAQVLPYGHALVLIPSYVVVLMLIRLFTGSMEYILAGTLVALFLISSEILVNLQKMTEKAVGKALFRKTHDAYETLSTFSKALVRILDLKTLTEEIVRTLVKVMGIKTVTLYLLDKEKNIYAPASSSGLPEEDVTERHFAASNPLPRHLEKMQAILVREELEHAPPRSRAHPLIATLHAMRADVCVPFINKNILVGFCVLGPRTMHQMYSDQDLSLLTTLAQATAIALDNAALYAELKRSQTLVRRADRLRSLETIAGGFAHEIRNPLTSIKTFIQLTPERKDDPEFIGYFSTVVAEDVARIERLIQEILDYSRYMQPKFLEEDVNDVVASCLYFVRIKADAKSVIIQQDYARELPRVTLDRQQIKQVLLNLLLNAIDAMNGDGGRLIVKTYRLAKSPDDSWVQIEVGDTGCGIAPADLDHIFDPFYTTKHASEEREGTGLGLTIAHQIIQEHGGHITVESQLGKGTTFSISLPVKPVAVACASKDEGL
jgi:two-component system NtrC family sensor kinase